MRTRYYIPVNQRERPPCLAAIVFPDQRTLAITNEGKITQSIAWDAVVHSDMMREADELSFLTRLALIVEEATQFFGTTEEGIKSTIRAVAALYIIWTVRFPFAPPLFDQVQEVGP